MLKRAAVCCFANVQEGRSPRILREIAEAAGSVPGAALVRVFSDRTFDRSGLCILGEGEAVGDAVVAMVTKALERIDLTSEDRQHNNRIHHHIGAVDLLPFHPIGSASLEDAAAVSRSVAMRLGRDLHLPVLLYGAAHHSGKDLRSLRKTTSFFRSGGKGAQPDFGPSTASDRSGITVCGASEYVVNFNVALATIKLDAGTKIAKAVRAVTEGGMEGVEAMAYIHTGPDGKDVVEVACNLKAPSSLQGNAAAVFARIASLAETSGIRVVHGYTTNPTPDQLVALLAQTPHARGFTLVPGVAMPVPNAGWAPLGDGNVEWLVPPGEAPMI